MRRRDVMRLHARAFWHDPLARYVLWLLLLATVLAGLWWAV